MMKYITVLPFCLLLILACQAQSPENRTVAKNGMTVSWRYIGERIHIEMAAPTDGWVTVGFNKGSGMQGAYLLMGKVVKGKAAVVEHYTQSAGNYGPISALGASPQVDDVGGSETAKQTSIHFSLPCQALSKYQRSLSPGSGYTLILAYSREDDFQHHSMMRTSVAVTL